jgi:hypothetical protein
MEDKKPSGNGNNVAIFSVDAWDSTKDRIRELDAESKRLKESLPSPFDVYDKDDNWVCKDTDVKPSSVKELNEKEPAIRKAYEWMEENGRVRVVTMEKKGFYLSFYNAKGMPVDIKVALKDYLDTIREER